MDRQPLDLGTARPTPTVRIARLFSDIFSPPAIYPAFGLVLVLTFHPAWKNVFLALLYGTFTSLLPVLLIFSLVRRGKAADIHVSSTVERTKVYLVATLGAGAALVIVYLLDGPPALLGLIWCNLFAMAIFWLISRRWLVSAHMASISLVTILSSYLYGLIGLALVPLMGLTFFFRLFLRRHTVLELLMGILLGAFIAGCAISSGVMY